MGLSARSPLGLSSSSFPFSVSREKSGRDASNVSSKLSVGSCRTNKYTCFIDQQWSLMVTSKVRTNVLNWFMVQSVSFSQTRTLEPFMVHGQWTLEVYVSPQDESPPGVSISPEAHIPAGNKGCWIDTGCTPGPSHLFGRCESPPREPGIHCWLCLRYPSQDCCPDPALRHHPGAPSAATPDTMVKLGQCKGHFNVSYLWSKVNSSKIKWKCDEYDKISFHLTGFKMLYF